MTFDKQFVNKSSLLSCPEMQRGVDMAHTPGRKMFLVLALGLVNFRIIYRYMIGMDKNGG